MLVRHRASVSLRLVYELIGLLPRLGFGVAGGGGVAGVVRIAAAAAIPAREGLLDPGGGAGGQ